MTRPFLSSPKLSLSAVSPYICRSLRVRDNFQLLILVTRCRVLRRGCATGYLPDAPPSWIGFFPSHRGACGLDRRIHHIDREHSRIVRSCRLTLNPNSLWGVFIDRSEGPWGNNAVFLIFFPFVCILRAPRRIAVFFLTTNCMRWQFTFPGPLSFTFTPYIISNSTRSPSTPTRVSSGLSGAITLQRVATRAKVSRRSGCCYKY